MVCRKCYSENVTNTFHDGKQQYLTRCADCSAVTWQPKDEADKYRREAKHLDLVKKYNGTHCQWCARTKEEIPPPGTLEAHHIIEYKDGGTDDRENILILCTCCHKDCHQKRTYFGHYKNFFSNLLKGSI